MFFRPSACDLIAGITYLNISPMTVTLFLGM